MADTDPYAAEPEELQPQLTQARVPLEEAGDALMVRDASGRIPIVVVPKRTSRANPWLVLAGIVAIIGGAVATARADTALWVGVAIPVGALLIFLGLFQAFRVMVPEGANALLLRGGKYFKTLDSGLHWVLPYYPVSHLITRRVIPFDVPAYVSPTSDNVPATVDTLVMFNIADPYKFVYRISADDFDHVFLAACQDALRQLVRSTPWQEVLNLSQRSTSSLREAIAADVADYGVEVNRVNITYAGPPFDFMKSQEMRELWMVQRAEVEQRQALEVQRVEQEAATESLRLQRLQERLQQFPRAASWEWEGVKMDVARSLAGNTRAFVQVGQNSDIARAFVASELMAEARIGADAPDNDRTPVTEIYDET
jgi:regulator of protease activity HflC (stomatin/prohibitin superfamily)